MIDIMETISRINEGVRDGDKLYISLKTKIPKEYTVLTVEYKEDIKDLMENIYVALLVETMKESQPGIATYNFKKPDYFKVIAKKLNLAYGSFEDSFIKYEEQEISQDEFFVILESIIDTHKQFDLPLSLMVDGTNISTEHFCVLTNLDNNAVGIEYLENGDKRAYLNNENYYIVKGYDKLGIKAGKYIIFFNAII